MAIVIEKDVYSEIFASKVWDRAGFKVKIDESTSEPAKEATESEETHSCPLCESKLETPISEERMKDLTDYILGVINENFEVEGDILEEEESQEETEEQAGE